MTIAIRGTVQSGSGTNGINHTAITGVTAGDLYLDIAHNTGGASGPTLDATYTFTSIGSGTDGSGRTWNYGRRVATGAETGMVVTATGSQPANIFLALSGIDTTTPIESYVQANGSFGTTAICAASTPTADNCWHVVVFAETNSGSRTLTTPSGYTALGSFVNVAGQGSMYAFYKDLGAGSSGVSTGTVSGVWNNNTIPFSAGFIVRSGASGPTVSTITGTTRLNASQRHSFGIRR
jgi:hypothetical protein